MKICGESSRLFTLPALRPSHLTLWHQQIVAAFRRTSRWNVAGNSLTRATG